MLRSGPFARVWHRVRHRRDGSEGAILAHPDHSLRGFRKLGPRDGALDDRGRRQATPLQAYRQALGRVESVVGQSFL